MVFNIPNDDLSTLEDWNPYFNIRLPSRDIDYTNKDYEAFRRMMIQGLQEFMPEYTDTSQTDAGVVIIEQIARAMDIMSFHQDAYANEAFFLSSRDRETAVRWARGLGYIPSNRTAAIHDQVFRLTSPANELGFVVGRGVRVKTQQTVLENSVMFETTEDLTIPPGYRGDERDENGRYMFTVPVRQGTTIRNEPLGSSSGLPNQRFQLANRHAIVDTIQIHINEGGGFIRWQRVNTFIDSSRTDRHYMVEVDQFDNTTIVFGDGFAGKIPDSFISNIAATYAIGGGVVGNVVPRTITELATALAGIESTFNPYPEFTPGAEKETLEEIKRNAPAHLRTLWRAVTLQDHKDLVLKHFPSVKFANAIQCPYDRNNALVFVILHDNAPVTQSFRLELLEFFDRRKMVGNSVYLIPPRFKGVSMTADLHVRGDFVASDTKDRVENVVGEYFKIGNYDFDTEFVYSDFEAMINNTVNGVRSFRITVPDPVDRIAPRPEEVLVLESLEIRVFGGIDT